MALKAVAAPLGSPVGGTGAFNTIPRWTGASTLGDSGLIDNGSTVSFVGRNITAPSTAGGASYVLAPTSGQVFGQTVGSSVWYLGRTTAAGAAVQPDICVNASGNVGIGAAIPRDLLHAYGGSIKVGADAINSFLSFGDENIATRNNGIYRPASSNTLAIGSYNLITFNVSATALGAQTERARIDSAGNLILNPANTGATIQAAGSQQGLKLPATPGNGNANTLDSYQEGTRVLSAGDLSGWTYVTATQYWTLVGRTVTLHTVFTGGTSSATGGATIATPPLLTPLRIAAGAATNSSGTALGNGVCVVASTSSTTGTVITSNAISSSAVDKVLTVTYETAGL